MNKYGCLLMAALITSACQSDQQPRKLLPYPETAKTDQVDTYHGTAVPDPYRWLEDDRSPETATWVEAQNQVTFGFLDQINFRADLKKRLEQLNDYEKISAPFREGDYEYFYKNDGLQNHAIVYRTPVANPDAEPEVFLDPNTFSEDGTTGLAGLSFSKDGSLVAYQITEGGSDWRKVYVMDTRSKALVGEILEDVKFSGLSWKGNKGFYYSSYDNPDKQNSSQLSAKTANHKLYFHTLGQPQDQDQLVFGGDKQPNRYIFAEVTEDEQYLVISAAQNTSGNQLYIMDLSRPTADPVLIQDDYFASCSVLTNEGADFYLYTNIGAPKYRVVRFELSQPQSDKWQDVIPESEHVLSASVGGGKFFASYLVDAKTQVQQFDLQGKLERDITLPGIGSAYGFSAKKTESSLYYTFTSFTYPNTIYKYDIAEGLSQEYRRSQVDFNPEDYETRQVFYTSKDGTRVPMFIVFKKGIAFNGKNPTLLYAYGGFNVSLTPAFSASRIAWLEQGGIYAQPNIRGGGEYGEAWHLAGTQLNKQNVFDDFIAAANYLIEEDYTTPEFLAISGGSNGGLLVGACMTQRPELFKVALPAVGVLDMLRYHTFTAGAGWAADYGTADDSPEMFAYLKQYSPYHALQPGTAYPATLVTTADHDDRVVPAHSFKFAARLQEYHAGDNPVLIRVQTRAGHGSVSTEQRLALEADTYAFTWANMGLEPVFTQLLQD
ncbi:MAG: prolyl oligopeptidase family serine peptidase [Saprospiraceae bacterium]|nr:prolyl oligopeptidase family serine peptidase [Saprospiraceae bacterium]